MIFFFCFRRHCFSGGNGREGDESSLRSRRRISWNSVRYPCIEILRFSAWLTVALAPDRCAGSFSGWQPVRSRYWTPRQHFVRVSLLSSEGIIFLFPILAHTIQRSTTWLMLPPSIMPWYIFNHWQKVAGTPGIFHTNYQKLSGPKLEVSERSKNKILVDDWDIVLNEK